MRRGGSRRSHRFSPSSVRLIVLAVLSSLLTTVEPLDTKKAEARPADHTILRAASKYAADFTNATSRGTGLRITTEDQNRYLDVRLKGVQGSDPTVSGGIYTYNPSPNLSLYYDVFPNRVKETIVSRDTSRSEFRFVIRTKGLNAQQEGGRVVFRSGGIPQIVTSPVIAWDANRRPIPASVSLDGDDLVVRLDPLVLAASTAPITIDPEYLQSCQDPVDPDGGEVGNCGGGGSPDIRTTFVTPDSDVIAHFYRDALQADGTARILVSASTNGGDTFATETVVPLSVGEFSIFQAPDGVFLLAYSKISPSQSIGYREVTLGKNPDGTLAMTVTNEATQPLLAPGISADDAPLIVQYGATGTDRHLAIGYHSFNQVLGHRYLTYVTSDGGDTWTPGVCSSSAAEGTMSAFDGRPLCLTLEAGQLLFRDLTETGWSAATSVITAGSGLPSLPSSVVTDDGALHLVSSRKTTGSSPPEVLHAFLTPTGTAFSAPQVLGPGVSPVISTGGTSLHVYATQVISVTSSTDVGESYIRPYIATDGTTFIEGKPLSGGVFDHVLDYNAAWEFNDATTRDGLFLLVDSVGAVGNGIGSSDIPHRLDHPAKRLSFSFIPDLASGTTATLSSVEVFLKAQQSPKYRIGIQGDSSGVPSGSWLDQVEVAGQIVSGAYTDIAASDHPYKWVSADIEDTTVSAGTRYHLVIETIPDPTGLLGGTASSSKWIEVRAIGAASEAMGPLSVLDGSSSGWTQAPFQVPRFVVRAGSTNLANQVLEPGPQDAAHEYSLPGESFVAPRDITPSEIKVRLSKVNNPSSSVFVTVRLLDSGGTEQFSSAISSPQVGWMSVPVSGVSLTEGSRYRILIDSPNKGLGAYWALDTSRGNGPGGITAAASWDGATSVQTLARDRKGFNDRSYEAERSNPFPFEINLFNSSTSDALYVGDDQPFDFITLIREQGVGGLAQSSPSLNYFNGSSWNQVTATSIAYNGLGRIVGGYVDFTPPTDWQQTTVDGKAAYWIKVVSSASTPTRIRADRITSIGNYTDPGVAPRLGVDTAGYAFAPLAFDRRSLPAGKLFLDYDSEPPFLATIGLAPHEGGNTMFASQPIILSARDPGSGVAWEDTTITLADETIPDEFSYSSFSGDDIEFNPAGWAKTAPITLQPGHLYSAAAWGNDNAGNRSSISQAPAAEGGGFLMTEAEVTGTMAAIAPTGCSVATEINPVTGRRPVSCENVAVSLQPSTVTLSHGTRHGGIGFVDHDVPLAFASVTITVGNATSTYLPYSGGGDGPPRALVAQLFKAIASASAPFVIEAAGATRTMGSLTFEIPPEAENATLYLEPVLTTAAMETCADWTVVSGVCYPDPIRSYQQVELELGELLDVCTELDISRAVSFACPEGVEGYSPGGIEIARDHVELTNEITRRSQNGTLRLGDPAPLGTSSYVRFLWEISPSDLEISPSTMNDVFKIHPPRGGLSGWIARTKCGWYAFPRPEVSDPFVERDAFPSVLPDWGFHRTAFYADPDDPFDDWTRPQTADDWLWCGFDTFRDHALVPHDEFDNPTSPWRVQVYAEDPHGEPNPEILDYQWPYEEWGHYTFWWHDQCNPDCPID